ncbi:carbohydrate ABC transporter permease [Paenibacillus methanolicus]|uniref:Putative aldouronate transport system permease protein n=1 Tax=Paenibacillus methanolicus TaxID=582686 RepID=A0A5S5CK93_9BACL|nr:carbohydrate ABC transporter permease [Paenibacillus methanolicus]TYP79327.1 putative aldouronate transport system permease protein [Paenibacillus methanolicus]
MVKRISIFNIVNVVILAIVAFSALFPFIHMAAVSLSASEFVVRNEVSFWPKGLQFEVYKEVFKDDRLFTGYRNTILYVVLGTAISLATTAMAAYSLSRSNLVFGKTIMMMIVFTMFFSGGMIPTYLVVRSYGFMNSIWAMVIPNMITSVYLIVMRTFFQGIPREVEESSKIDGASDYRMFFSIILPLSKAVLMTIGLFYAVAIWNNFFTALLYLRDESLYPLQLIVRSIVMVGQVGEAIDAAGADGEGVVLESLKYAVILVSTLPILVIYPFIQKHFVNGVLIGSVKG